MIIMIVILAGIVYGTYSATMDQLPDLTGTVMGNTTTSSNITNNSIGTVYMEDKMNTTNTSVIITQDTLIYKEIEDNKQVKADMKELRKGCNIEVHTIGDPSNTIPPQVVAEKIIIKRSQK